MTQIRARSILSFLIGTPLLTGFLLGKPMPATPSQPPPRSPIVPAILGTWQAGHVWAVDQKTKQLRLDYTPIDPDLSDSNLMPYGQRIEFTNGYDKLSNVAYWQAFWLLPFPANACRYPFLQYHCQAQLAEMAQPVQDKHRTYVLQELEKEWQRHKKEWAPRFVHTYTFAERRLFFSKFYTWALQVPLEKWSDLLKVGTLLLRGQYYGWPPEDLALAKEYIETTAAPPHEDPAPAIQWLEWAFDQ